MKLEIKAGKCYLNGMGQKCGPMKKRPGKEYPFIDDRGLTYKTCGSYIGNNPDPLDLIAEWPEEPTSPKVWRDMTPEEKGALLLAEHEGKVIDRSHDLGATWKEKVTKFWHDKHVYRVRPEPVRDTVTLQYDSSDDCYIVYRPFSMADVRELPEIEIPTYDGNPIPGTYRNDAGDVITIEAVK